MSEEQKSTVEEFEQLFAERGVIGDRKFKEYCTGIYEDIIDWHINTLNSYKAELVRRIDGEKIDKLVVQVSPVHIIGFDVAPTFNEALERVKEIIN